MTRSVVGRQIPTVIPDNRSAIRDLCQANALSQGDTGLRRLVYVEAYDTVEEAIVREKAMKEWQRGWKVRLIEEHNPEWDDLYGRLNW